MQIEAAICHVLEGPSTQKPNTPHQTLRFLPSVHFHDTSRMSPATVGMVEGLLKLASHHVSISGLLSHRL